MSTPPQSAATHSQGALAAWAGGSIAALGAAGLTLLLHGQPLGHHLWRGISSPPVQPLGTVAAFSIAFLTGLAAAWAGATVRPARRVCGLLAAALVLTLTQTWVFALHGMAWEPLPTLLSVLGAGSIAALLRTDLDGPSRWFRGRVSAKTLHALTLSRDTGFLKPGQRQATVLTCRLLNENALREILPAREFLKLCGAFRQQASSVLIANGACLDPTESSGIRAFFGLPLPSASPADEAVAAALLLDDAMREFTASLKFPSGTAEVEPVCGIGIASGTLTAGLVGHSYSVLGGAVELSRWLAAETAGYGIRLLTDSATHLAADRIEDRPLEFVNPPDGAAVEIFQLLGTNGSLSAEAIARRNAFRDALMLLRAGHAEDALTRFADAREGLTVPDPVLDHFVAVAEDQLKRDSPSAPAPDKSPPSAFRPPAAPRSAKPPRKLPRRP